MIKNLSLISKILDLSADITELDSLRALIEILMLYYASKEAEQRLDEYISGMGIKLKKESKDWDSFFDQYDNHEN